MKLVYSTKHSGKDLACIGVFSSQRELIKFATGWGTAEVTIYKLTKVGKVKPKKVTHK